MIDEFDIYKNKFNDPRNGKPNIIIKQNMFTKLFYILMKLKDDEKVRYIISRGAYGSSKSYSTAQYLVTRCMQRKNFRCLVVMRLASSLKSIAMQEIKDQIEIFGIEECVKINLQEMVISFTNGSKIYFRGGDKPDKIKGLKINYAWIEEADQVSLELFDQINARLRGTAYSVINRQMILTFNPTSKKSWIYTRFFEKRDPDAFYLKSTYHSNPFIDDKFKENMDKLKEFDYNQYRVGVLAEFGTLTSGGELWNHFRAEIHTAKIAEIYDNTKPLLLSFDENYLPYITCIVAQTSDEGKTINFIDEILLKPPLNDIKSLGSTIREKYRHHEGGIIIFGDATSRRRSVRSEGNFYTLIIEELKQFHPILEVPKSNPGVSIRSEFINRIFFDGANEGLKIVIDTRLDNTIDDIMSVKRAADGGMIKTKIKDPKTNETYEDSGHIADAFSYIIIRLFNEQFNNYKNGGYTKLDMNIWKKPSIKKSNLLY